MTGLLAETIRARRMSRGLEREELARRVGCDVRSIRRWEGGGLPQARYVPALRRALDLTIEEVDSLLLTQITRDAPRYRIEGCGYAARTGTGLDAVLGQLIDLDRKLIDPEAALSADAIARWVAIFEALPDSWRLLTLGDAIIGNWHFVPLDPETYARCRTGAFGDEDLRVEHLQSLDLPGRHDMYLAALILEPAHHDGRTMRLLLQSYCERLAALATRDVYFDRICASAWTPAAVVLCRRLGMEPVAQVPGGTARIFEGMLPDVLEALKLPEATPVLDLYASVAAGRQGGPGPAPSAGPAT